MAIALSYSRWKDADCPFRFHALHIAKTHKEPETDIMRLGSHVHHLIEGYRRHCHSKGLPSDIEYFNDLPLQDDAAPMIENFMASNLSNIPMDAQWVQIEGRFSFDSGLNVIPGDDAWFSSKTAFRMILDYAYFDGDALWIIDDKSGWGDPDPLQLDLYAYLGKVAFESTTGQVGAIKRIVCIFNEVAKRKIQDWEYSPGETGLTRQRILGRLEAVNSWTEYPAVPCKQCRFCTVPGCERRKEAETSLMETAPVIAVPKAITNPLEATNAMLFIQYAEDIVGKVKELLRAYVEEHGPVSSERLGMIAELRPNTPWKAKDTEKIVKTLVAYGVDPKSIWGSLTLTKSDIEKLCKKSKCEERLPMILAMGETKEYKPKFGIYKDSLNL